MSTDKIEVKPNYTQKDIIRKHLEKHGSITESRAGYLYGIGNLGSVISLLRNSGFPVNEAIRVKKSGNAFAHKRHELKYDKTA